MKRKIFINIDLENKIKIEDKKVINRVKNVYKLKQGDTIIFINGSLYEGKYVFVDPKKMIFERLEIYKRNILPKREINLFLSFIRKDNFEFIIEKAGELGVKSITPLITERCQWKTEIVSERWLKILYSSLEVAEWGFLPEIKNPVKLENMPGDSIILDKQGEKIDFNSTPLKLNIAVGPEGGFSDKEIKILKNKNCKFISLGDVTLKTDTAVLAALALLNFPF